MKKLIAMAVAILITGVITAFASGKKPGESEKQINYQMSFSKIVVADDIEIELRESDSKIITIAGNDLDMESVAWKIKDDVLYLRSRSGSLKDRLKVTINVNQLKELVIKGRSSVSSLGHLSSPSLHVYLEDDCFVSIRNKGEIAVVNGYDIEIDVKKIVGDVTVGR